MESQITIYDKSGGELLKVPVTRTSIRKRVLMSENHVLLVFNHDSYIDFRKGSYIIYKGFKFEIMTDVYPEMYRNGWKYSLQFDAKDGFLRKYNIFYRKQDITEVVFALTTDLLSFGNVICDCINHELGGTNWRVKAIPAEFSEVIKTLSFKGEKLFDALTMIAEQFECEWWIEENGEFVDICFGKLSFGTEEEFEEGKVVTSIPRKSGDNSDFGTRFFVYGSTRNLTSDYGHVEQGGTTNHISEIRLRLPDGIDYIDAWENLAPEDVVHQVVFLDDIYPKNTDVITKVETEPRQIEGSTETFDAYIITADNTPFLPSDIIKGETLGCVFETGSLQGQSFELSINKKYNPDTWKPSDGFDKKFEIIHVMNGDIIVPNKSFKPEVGDKFVITGVRLPKERIREAEQELLQVGQAWAKKKSQDTSVYDCPTNPVFCQENEKNYDLGQKVKLVGDRFGVSGRSSRIQGYEKKLWNEYEATYTVGDNSSYSRLKQIEGEIKESQYSERIGVVNGVGIYLIRNKFDNTQPTNYNAYSALASLEKFVTYAGYVNQPVRTTDDVRFRDIIGRIITITDGFMTDNFVAGMSGVGVGVVNKSEVHADKVLVRKYLEVLALVVQKMYWRGGMQVLSPAGMKISRLEEFGDYWRCYMETEDGQTNDFTIGAQARCNAFGDVQKYYWRLVVGIGSDYIDLSKNDCDTGSAAPQVGDDVVQIGHRTDPNLQWAVIDSSFSADAGRTIYAGVNSYSLSDKWVLREGVSPVDQNRIGLFTRHGEFSDIIEGLGTDIKNAQTSADSALDEAQKAQLAADEAQKEADSAKVAANSAMMTANANSAELVKINDDGTISPVEKTALKQQQADMQTEYNDIMASAGLYGISTTAYKTAYDQANAALTKYTAVSPEYISAGTDYANIAAYYTARQNILNAISTAANKKAEDAKTAADKAQDTANSAQTAVNTVKNIVDNLTGIIIPDLQNQVDGAIQSWDGEVEPTLNNYPANEWKNDAERSKHVGDTYIYYTKDAEGKTVSSRYNFRFVNGTYKWEKIADSVSAELEKDFRELTGTVGKKNSITYSNNVPTPPYNIDDLWIKEDKTIYICKTQKMEGMSSDQSDWTVVNDAMLRLKNIADDNIITKEEKTTLRDTWSQIQKEFAKYQTQATTYEVPITTLQNAYNALNTFLTNTVKISQNTDTSITVAQKTQYNQLFADYYAARTDFANLIADKLAEGAVDNIQVGGVNILDGSTTGTGWIGYTSHIGTEFSKTSSLTTETQVFSGNLNISGGVEIVVSFYAKHTGNVKSFEFYILPTDYDTYGALRKSYNSGTAWTYNEFKLTTPEKWGTGASVVPVKFRLDHNGSADGTSSTVYLKDIQIEYGNKATTYSVPIKDQQEIAQNLADEAVGNLQIGSVNLISKKMMLRWNEKDKNIAVWGQDADGVYLNVNHALLYNDWTASGKNPVFNLKFKTNTQYVLSVEWKLWGVQAYDGLMFVIIYTDGAKDYLTLGKSQTGKIRQDYISKKGKTISKISSTYGAGDSSLIYNISLIEGNKPLQGFPVAEDAIGSSVNLVDGSKELTVTASSSNNHAYNRLYVSKIKPNTVYHVQTGNIENLVGSPSRYSLLIYNKSIGISLATNNNYDKNGGIIITKNDFEEQDGYLLCYAGIAGVTAGNSVKFTEVMLVEGFYPAAVWTPSAGDVSKEISDVSKALASFQGTVNGAFKDGVISAAEAKAIASNIGILKAEKADIDASYTNMYANGYLSGTPKTNLYNAKVAYNTAHTNLINSINAAISDGATTPTEKADVDAKFTAYGTALGTYKTRVAEADKTIQDAVRSYAGQDITKGSSYYVDLFSFHDTFGIFKFATTIPEKTSRMLRVDIEGYCYGESTPFGMSLVFYTYTSGLARYGYIVTGGNFVERVRLGVKSGKVEIELKLVKDIYYPGFNMNISSTLSNIPIDYSTGWTGVGKLLSAGDYIDDTYTNIVVVPRVNSFSDDLANKAQKAADAAQSAIAVMNDDSIFDIKEKQAIRTQWENINGVANTTGTGTAGSYYKTKSLATGLSVSALDTAYTALRTYLNGLALYTNSNTSNFARATMAAKFTAYYDAEIALTHSIADKLAKDAAKTVQVTANSQTFKYGYGYSGTPVPSSIVLTATARSFTPSSYQWQYLNGSTWTNISGATAATYTVAPSNTTLFPSGTNLRTFRCICNGDSSLSDLFTLAKLADGDTGATGAAGKGVKSTAVTYQSSTSGTTVPTGTWSASIPSVAANQYLWTRMVITYTDNTTSTSYSIGKMGANGAAGAAGKPGADGKGIKSTVVTYQASTSGTTVPTGSWGTTIPSVAANQYLWTRTVITYTDNNTSTSYSIGKMGATGATGAAGKDAYTVLLTNEAHTFAGSTSAALAGSTTCQVIAYKGTTQVAATIGTITGQPTGMSVALSNNGSTSAGFTVSVTTSMTKSSGILTIPVTVDGKAFTLNFSYALALKGATGSAGISYWRNEGWLDASAYDENKWIPFTGTILPKAGYGRICVSVQLNSGKKPSWSTHSAGFSVDFDFDMQASGWGTTQAQTLIYADTFNFCSVSPVSCGQMGYSSTPVLYLRGGGKYYVKTDFLCTWTPRPDGYTWTSGEYSQTVSPQTSRPKPVGTSIIGRGIKSVANKYAVSSSNTTAPTSWSDTVPSTTTTNKYLWNYEIITYTDNTTAETSKRVIGVHGATGAQGVGIKSITEYYLATTASSGVTTSTSGWTTGMQVTTTDKKYLWNYEIVTYTDGNRYTSTPVIIGTHGATGAAGKGVKSTAITYQASASGTTAPTGTWSSSIPSVAAGQYLWTRTIITYTDNTTSTMYSVGKIGTNGTNGNAGNGVSSTTVTYQASTSGTAAPTGTWSATIPSVAAGSYLWTKTVISYTNGSNSTIYSVGKMGNTGAQGAQGDPGESINGVMKYKDPMFKSGVNGTGLYPAQNNGGTVAWERILKSSDSNAAGSPYTGSTYCMRVTASGGTTTNHLGGFTFNTQSRANAVFFVKISAKIPVGYTITHNYNSYGTGQSWTALTSRAGTGKYETYLFKIKCGYTGTFSTICFFSLSGPIKTAADPLRWYVDYATVFDESADGYADVAFTAKDEFAQNIGYNSLQDMIDKAKAKGPLVKAGLINAELVDTGALIADNAFISSLKTKIITAGSITADKLSVAGFVFADNKIYGGADFGSGAGVKITSTTSEKSFKAYKDTRNYVEMHYNSSTDWGFKGIANGYEVFRLGYHKYIIKNDKGEDVEVVDTNKIAGMIIGSNGIKSEDFSPTNSKGTFFGKDGLSVYATKNGILAPSSGGIVGGRITAIGENALIIGCTIEAKQTDASYGSLREQVALQLNATNAYPNPMNPPVALDIVAGDISMIGKSVVRGFGLNVRTVTSSTTLTAKDDIIIVTAGSAITITLPKSGVKKGKMFWIRKCGTGNITLNGTLMVNWGSTTSSDSIKNKDLQVLIWAGSYWTSNYLG